MIQVPARFLGDAKRDDVVEPTDGLAWVVFYRKPPDFLVVLKADQEIQLVQSDREPVGAGRTRVPCALASRERRAGLPQKCNPSEQQSDDGPITEVAKRAEQMRDEGARARFVFLLSVFRKAREPRATGLSGRFKTFGSQRMPGQPQRQIARLVGDFVLVLDPSPEAQDLELVGVGMSGKILGDPPGDSMDAARAAVGKPGAENPNAFSHP